MSVLIIEGVTGSGKTSTIAALREITSFEFFDEEATFDDFVAELARNPESANARAASRLAGILDRIETPPPRSYLLERFHFSQLALGNDWRWYQGVNQRCAALSAKVAVLVFSEEQIPKRSLYRTEYGNSDWQQLLDHYGTEHDAIDALVRAQRLRLEAIRQSRLDYRAIDTTGKSWPTYASEIARWVRWTREK